MPETGTLKAVDRIWDLVQDLDESGSATGKISYDRHGEGRLTVALGGRRVSVYVDVEGPDA